MLMRRPGWTAGLAWLITCLIGAWLSETALWIALAIGVVGTVFVLCISALRRHRALLMIGITVCLALTSLLVRFSCLEKPLYRSVGSTVSLRAQVVETGDTVILKVKEGDLPSGTLLYYWGNLEELDIQRYAVVDGSFVLRPCETDGLWQLHARANGLCFGVSSADTPQITAGEAPWYAFPETLRTAAVAAVNRFVSGDTGAVINGICFGEDDALSAQAVSNFRVSGVSHLFSVSGFHLAVIAQGVMWLLCRFRASRFLRAVITSLTVGFFMILVGLGPSVIRAGVLCLLVQLSTCAKRQADTRNSLGIALLLLLVSNPYAVYDVSLLLSFFATFGLVFLCEPLRKILLRPIPDKFCHRFPRIYGALETVVTLCCLTLSATIATLPVTILFFGEVSVVSLPANLLSSYPASFIMIAGCVASVFALAGWSWVAAPLLFLNGLAANFLLWVAETVSKFPVTTLAIRDTYLLLWVVGTLLLLYAGFRLLRKRGVIMVSAASVVVLIASLVIRFYATNGVSHIRAVGLSRDVAVYLQDQSRTVLFLSPESVNDLYTVRTQLRQDGVERVDVLVLMGGSYEAVSAVPAVLDSVTSQTALVYTDKQEHVPSYYSRAVPLKNGHLELWNGASVAYQDGFFLLGVGTTRILIAPNNGDMATLPALYCTARAAICRGNYVWNTHVSQAQLAVLPAQAGTSAFVTAGTHKFLESHSQVLMTRGENDIYC